MIDFFTSKPIFHGFTVNADCQLEALVLAPNDTAYASADGLSVTLEDGTIVDTPVSHRTDRKVSYRPTNDGDVLMEIY